MGTEKELLEDLKSIGIQVSSVRDLANGYPNYDQAEPILRKYRKMSKDIQFREAIECALNSIEKELIDDLKKVGINISSVWDLVNGPNNYKQAEPVLIKHFMETKECWYKEGIVRALGVKGFKNAVRPLLDEFKNAKDELYKWAIGNSLAIIAPKNCLDELISIMADEEHGTARQMIAETLGKIKDPRGVPVLLKALEDDVVAGHAIKALGKIGDTSVIEAIRPFTSHKMRWIRNAAETALKRIEGKTKTN